MKKGLMKLTPQQRTLVAMALASASILIWAATMVVAAPSWNHAIAAVAFILPLTAVGIVVFIAEKRDREKPPPWKEAHFQLRGDDLFSVGLVAAVSGLAFGTVFGGFAVLHTTSPAALQTALDSPVATVAPPWQDVGVEFLVGMVLILASIVYWALVYRYLKKSVQRRLTRVMPEEQPTLES